LKIGMADAADDASALSDFLRVSRETRECLERFVALLRKWQAAENLISPNTLPQIWRRHVADSAQLVRLFPQSRRWLDLGSGGGFPGIVVAILLSDTAGSHVDLVESNGRKCAFLRQAIRETRAPASVHEGRIADLVRDWRAPIDVVTARALAPLDRLFEMTQPLVARGARAAFHKGRDFAREIDEASQSWDFDMVKHASLVEDGSVILEITRLARKA
jgi:16S rRNA (guanine527-N7)-methyltransferase